jgi:ferrous iron transport protein A
VNTTNCEPIANIAGYPPPLLIITRIMDMSTPVKHSLSLESLPHRQVATVSAIDWTHLSTPEARRLREFGFDEGVGVEVLHRASLGKGPIACRIGRMTVALRRAVAGAILVSPVTQ